MENQAVTKDSIIQDALKDPNFKTKLINNPEQAIQDKYGIVLKKGQAKVLQDTNDCWYLVIPQDPQNSPTGGVW